jgi:hypothetical protein
MRKIDVVALLVSVVLTVSTRATQSFAAMRRGLALDTGTEVARSAYWDRFTPGFTALLRWFLGRLVVSARGHAPRLTGLLSDFTDVVVADSSVVQVHDDLARVWKGTRHSAPAALKVHTLVRAVTGELLRFQISPEAWGDNRAFRLGWWAKGMLFLFDLAYSSPSLWWRVHRLGGFFLTRLPTSYNPEIVEGLRRHRGGARPLPGRRLRAALVGMQRGVVDVRCRFRAHVHHYGTPTGRNIPQDFRVVGIRNPDTRRYHLYVTNLPPERLPAEHAGLLYRLRWEVETFYKSAKSGCGLHELPSRREHIVRALIYAALIRLTLAMQSMLAASAEQPNVRVNPLAWLRVWNQVVQTATRRLLANIFGPFTPELGMLARLAADPSRSRLPTRFRLLAVPSLECLGTRWHYS